jgi:hypothetical protein
MLIFVAICPRFACLDAFIPREIASGRTKQTHLSLCIILVVVVVVGWGLGCKGNKHDRSKGGAIGGQQRRPVLAHPRPLAGAAGGGDQAKRVPPCDAEGRGTAPGRAEQGEAGAQRGQEPPGRGQKTRRSPAQQSKRQTMRSGRGELPGGQGKKRSRGTCGAGGGPRTPRRGQGTGTGCNQRAEGYQRLLLGGGVAADARGGDERKAGAGEVGRGHHQLVGAGAVAAGGVCGGGGEGAERARPGRAATDGAQETRHQSGNVTGRGGETGGERGGGPRL